MLKHTYYPASGSFNTTKLPLANQKQQWQMEENTEIQKLRDWLKRLNAWPEAGDQFLALMPQSSWNSPKPTDNDYKLMPAIARDVVSGSDIGARYPAFFQKLLAHPTLRHDFIIELQQHVDSNC